MRSRDRPIAPGFDRGIDLLVQIRHRARAYPRAPQRLGDVFHTAHRDARQIHLDQRLFDRGFSAPIALDDRRLEGLPAQLRHLQLDLAGLGLEIACVVSRPRVLPAFAALITLRPAELVRFRVEHRIQRFLDRAAHHLTQVITDPTLVNLDHLAHRLAIRLIVHTLLLSAILKGTLVARKCAKDFVRYPSLLFLVGCNHIRFYVRK